VFYEDLLHGEGESITRKLIELANRGELRAIGMCMDRLLPVRRGETEACEMPQQMKNPMDTVAAFSCLFEAVRLGDLTPFEAAKVGKLVQGWMDTMANVTFERRLREIEKAKGIVPPRLDGAPAASPDNGAGQTADQQPADASRQSETG
jgi:hypothetical protein